MRWHDTCTILHGTPGTDPDTGEATGGLDWDDPTETPGVPCSIQPRTQQDVTAGGGEVPVGGWFGYFPPGTDLTSADRVLTSWGLELTVDGEVAPWVRGGVTHHIECALGSA